MSEHQLALYNTLTRNKQAFEPIEPDNVRMYVCGPTVYDFAHIGNARPIIVFDVLYRLLRHLYGEGHVTYARNITDVDDKINARAGEEYPDLPLNEAIETVTKLTTKQFHDDIAALGVLPPDVEPTCTSHISEMITMIEVLIGKGNAYEAEQHVLLDTTSIANYGQLSGRSLDDMIAGARVEVAPYKKNPADSVLWKPSSDNQPGWDSPWGRGRPGWHIECSAMARKHLGEVFDVHGGGVDLVFPHHENELAQSCSAHDTAVMANVWMHNGFLQVEGEKMSKSLGNFITINDQLDQCGGSVLRLNMLKTHYRQPIDWTQASLKESGREHERWIELANTASTEDPAGMDTVVESLCDDLNTHQAITQLRGYYRDKNGTALRAGMVFLGLSLDKADLQGRQQKTLYSESGEFIHSDDVELLIAARNAARASKDFQEADRLRDALTAMGIILMDGKDPETGEIVTRWEVR